MVQATTHVDGIMATLTVLGGDKKVIVVNMDSEAMKTHLKNCFNQIEFPSFKMFAYSAAIDEYSRYVTYLMAINNEFYGSVTEAVQEAAKEMQLTKKRVLDKLASILHEQLEDLIDAS